MAYSSMLDCSALNLHTIPAHFNFAKYSYINLQHNFISSGDISKFTDFNIKWDLRFNKNFQCRAIRYTKKQTVFPCNIPNGEEDDDEEEREKDEDEERKKKRRKVKRLPWTRTVLPWVLLSLFLGAAASVLSYKLYVWARKRETERVLGDYVFFTIFLKNIH